jgi:hypothetical protein
LAGVFAVALPPTKKEIRTQGVAVTYTPSQRERIAEQFKGKKIERAEYVEADGDGYWVIYFEDGSEIAFRFMAEIVG